MIVINKLKCLNSTHLKIIAMVTMLADHLGKTLLLSAGWLTCVGRIAFPIFAFQIAEGYNHTENFAKYIQRMFFYALVSEIPYNLMGKSLLNPSRQNVLFTFCIALLVIRVIDWGRKKNTILGLMITVLATLAGYFLGFALMTDYKGYGVLTVVAFWLFGKIEFGWILQLASVVYINCIMMGEYRPQCFAVFALIPVFMYNGQKGSESKSFSRAVYIFYPLHMLLLALIMLKRPS